jgi:hypothetical protein
MKDKRIPISIADAIVLLLLLMLMVAGCGSSTSRISIYDRFLVSSDNTITDIVTGLQWKVGPDRDFDWFGAVIWVDDLGGNWRIPLLEELEELYEAGVNTQTWGPFQNTGWLVWSVDYASRDMSYPFCFIPNDVFLGAHTSPPSGQRVFAVLSPPGYGINAQRTFRSLNLCGFLLSLRYSG